MFHSKKNYLKYCKISLTIKQNVKKIQIKLQNKEPERLQQTILLDRNEILKRSPKRVIKFFIKYLQ